jgi:hypothetical protein
MKYLLGTITLCLLILGCRKWDNPNDKNAVEKDLIGVKFGGGIIFGPHLIVAQNDISGICNWSAANQKCLDYSITVNGKIYDDWRLPTIDDLNLLFINEKIIGGFYVTQYYWSSNEDGSTNAWTRSFLSGGQYSKTKEYLGYIRPVRAY